MDTLGYLMMSHVIPAEELARQRKLMENYGAQCIFLCHAEVASAKFGVKTLDNLVNGVSGEWSEARKT